MDGSPALTHFVSTSKGPEPAGNTLLKRRQLTGFGFKVVSMPYFDWHGKTAFGQALILRKRILPAATIPTSNKWSFC